MAATAPATRVGKLGMLIVIALLAVAAPAAAQPLGMQTQVSFTTPLEDSNAESTQSAIAYGGGRSLVVWEQRGVVSSRGDASTQIVGRFVDGTASPLGEQFPISDSTSTSGRETLPDVAYDGSRDRFVVVWQSTDFNQGGRSLSELIRGALVSSAGAVTPSVILTPDSEGFGDPAVSYGAAHDEFAVAYGDVNDEVVVRTIRAGDLGQSDGPLNLTAGAGFGELPGYLSPPDPMPDVAYDAPSNRWLVVFQAAPPEDVPKRGADLDPTPEIYGRSVDGSLNAAALQRISHSGDAGLEDLVASREPAVAADEQGGGFLAAYVHGYPFGRFRILQKAPPVEEIFSRRVNADGTVAGDAEQVSDGLPEGSEEPSSPARRPDVWHDRNADQFLISWGQEIITKSGRVDSSIEYEVFAKKVDAGGAPIEADTQVSNHRPDEDRQFDGELPAVTYDRSVCDYVVTWTGEEFADGSDEKQEIWDRAYDAPACPPEVAEQRTPGVGAAAAAVASQQARRCASRRSFPIRLVRRRGREYVFALISVNGQPVKVEYGDRVGGRISMIGLPVGRFAVDIEARLKDGRTLKGVRRYFTCSKKLPPSNGLERDDAL